MFFSSSWVTCTSAPIFAKLFLTSCKSLEIPFSSCKSSTLVTSLTSVAIVHSFGRACSPLYCLLTSPRLPGRLLNQPCAKSRPKGRSSSLPARKSTAVELPNLAKPFLENHAKAQAQRLGINHFGLPSRQRVIQKLRSEIPRRIVNRITDRVCSHLLTW